MRTRTIREGSVGLLILLGLGLLGGLVLWLRGMSLGNKTYEAIVEFKNVAGLQEGAPVRYRGVTIG
jgi:phospholipid/cholesterol/gamma-HCH transport system substrate-binding protein